MGSLNSGQHINKDYNRISIKHQGKFLKSVNSLLDVDTVVSNSGTIGTANLGLTGVVHASGTVKLEGMSLVERDADNTVERQKFTHDASVSGYLIHSVTRQEGKHVSVSTRHAYSSLEPMRTVTERKVFFPADWNIFNASGVAVGATLGTTDTDVTPSGVGTY